MARIKYTAIVDSINGTIGGTTFQRNAYGHTIKSKPNMIRPWTIAQQDQKIAMATCAKLWRTLTDPQRTAWETWAEANPRPSRLNAAAFLSGYNLFLLYHRYRRLYDLTTLTNPSLTLQSCDPAEYIVYRSGALLKWETNPSGVTGTWRALCFMTNPIPLGREFVNITPRFMTGTAYASGTVVDVTNQFNLRFGQLPNTGDWIGMKVVLFCTTTAQVIVTPTAQSQLF